MLHGGDLHQASTQYGIAPDKWLDLSTGINPCPYHIDSLPQNLWHRLPSPTELGRLEERARYYYRVSDDADIYGCPGLLCPDCCASPACIQTPLLLLLPVKPIRNTSVAGLDQAGQGLRCSMNAPANLLNRRPGTVPGSKGLVIVNPNNPTGRLYSPQTLLDTKERLGQDGFLVVDEAFMDCTPGSGLAPHAGQRGLVILRSFGKFFGLAGLRLGFAIGHPDEIRALRRALGAWPVSSAAIHIATQAFRDAVWIDRTGKELATRSQALNSRLAENGLDVLGSTSLFSLVGNINARNIHEKLAKNAVWTRIFDYEPDWIRIGLPKNSARLAQFVNALP